MTILTVADEEEKLNEAVPDLTAYATPHDCMVHCETPVIPAMYELSVKLVLTVGEVLIETASGMPNALEFAELEVPT